MRTLRFERQHKILDFSEIDTLVFQLTQPQRDAIVFTVETKFGPMTLADAYGNILNADTYESNGHDFKKLFNKSTRDMYLEYLLQNNLDLEQEYDNIVLQNLNNVKVWLEQVVQHGIKVFVTTWPHEFVKHIKNDRFFDDKFVTFKYKDKIFESISQLMSKENPEMTIKTDYENFLETPKDHHPSKTCHDVMAENLINAMKKNG